jgi:DNA polymerase-3 subunit alpha
VERPDINQSMAGFTVRADGDGHKVIRFGLGAVKGVGLSAVEAALAARDEGGPFASLHDLCQRVDSHKANRRVIEALVKCGAFDSASRDEADRPLHRAQIFAAIGPAMDSGAQAQRDRRSGQTSLFGLLGDADRVDEPARVERAPEVEPWTPKQVLAFEKEALGFYISGHPLDRYRADLSRYATATTLDFVEGRRAAGDAAIGGVVAAYREMPTKRGDGKLAFFQLEDPFGQIEVVVFPKTFEKVRHILVSDEPLLCSGKVKDEEAGEARVWRLLLEDATPLAQLRESKTSRVDIHLNADTCSPEQIDALRLLLASSRGSCKTVLRLAIPERSETVIVLGDNWSVAPTEELLSGLERLFGQPVARLN